MATLGLYFATNRAHEGDDRWHPDRYGKAFSSDGLENLRFGWLEVEADDAAIARCFAEDPGFGAGDGNALAALLTEAAATARIEAYPEKIAADRADTAQPNAKFGSKAMFADLQKDMLKRSDVLVFVHGFNVSWEAAVGSALALQLMQNRDGIGDDAQRTTVVLFSWPSDGSALPMVAYKSDRSDAKASGYAFARALLKLRDHLAALGGLQCGQDLHLLCHSMGNYVLQNTLERMREFNVGPSLPRLFECVFLCAPDVDGAVLEPGAPMGDLHQLARLVTVYHNTGDLALRISDYTKGNPERLGTYGASRSAVLPDKVEQVDCSGIVGGLVEHSYYLDGRVADDILLSIDGVDVGDERRSRVPKPGAGVRWELR
ncbi:MAG: alpha/beta fold hydrolase [Planctomycetes bacterium]|nr:alpha/beta fold hydrolase [Planctomycetota bacterium]